MSYIGNPIVSTDFPVDYKSGNGSTTAFTLSIAPASVNSIDVQISGVSQSPQTYSVSGTTLTFSAAPPTGTNNIVVRHLGIAGIPNTPSAGSVVPTSIGTGYSLWNLSGSDINYTAGNVGIGNAPSAWAGSGTQLQMKASFSLRTDGSTGQVINNAYYDGGSWRYLGTGVSFIQEFGSGASGGLAWYTAPSGTAGNVITYTERMRLDSSGNLLVGTTGTGSRLTVKGVSSDTFGGGVRLIKGSTSSYWEQVVGGDDKLYFGFNGTAFASINSTTGAYTALSDRSIKKNITDISHGLVTIQALRPVEYNMLEDEEQTQKHLGFIAQEAREVLPSSVSEIMDGYLGMDKLEIVPVLVKAIQELKAELDATKAEVAALKAGA